ncbi:MAG: hydrogenase nickel incorporation protein HypB [Myxococcales bacterium]|nr:hydrogenase nickel incorporation protein HypB [Myxococcales bacterium]
MKVTVLKDILDANHQVAAQNRALFERHRLLVLNLMSSPGAGKTALLERTLRDLRGRLRIGVIEGDIQTTLDARRVERAGAAWVHQINTRGACHLDAGMIAPALAGAPLGRLDVLVIENVGNLVCPAEFVVGEDHKVVLSAVTEGEDKPAKYPLMFRESSLLLVNKIDLLPHLDVKLAAIHRAARRVHPGLRILDVSCRTGQGLPAFYAWLESQLERRRKGTGRGRKRTRA